MNEGNQIPFMRIRIFSFFFFSFCCLWNLVAVLHVEFLCIPYMRLKLCFLYRSIFIMPILEVDKWLRLWMLNLNDGRENLIVAQLLKKFPACYEIHKCTLQHSRQPSNLTGSHPFEGSPDFNVLFLYRPLWYYHTEVTRYQADWSGGNVQGLYSWDTCF
jgi:hypothetical protein